MSTLRPLFLSLALLLLTLGASPRASANADCASCNGVSNTAACCRKLPGCEAYASKQAGVNFCRSSHAQEEPKQKVSGAQCQKNYNTCARNAQASGASMKSVDVNGKKLSRKDLAEALSAARKTCQDRLQVCKQHAR